jgi:hypothetical protein
MSNDMKYDDLVKLPLPKLREIALTLEVIQGVHGMNKEQVLNAICAVKEIENPYKIEADRKKAEARASIVDLKKQRKAMREELEQTKGSLSKEEKKAFRKKIRHLRRETRRLANV